MVFKIYNFAEQRMRCKIPDNKVALIQSIVVKLISNDEVVTVNFSDGTFMTFNSQELDRRCVNIPMGEEIITGYDNIKAWLHKRRVVV